MAVEVGDWVRYGNTFEGEVTEVRGSRITIGGRIPVQVEADKVRIATRPQTGLGRGKGGKR